MVVELAVDEVSTSPLQVSGTFQNVFNPPAPSPLNITNSEVKVEQSDVKVRKTMSRLGRDVDSGGVETNGSVRWGDEDEPHMPFVGGCAC